MDQKPSYKPRNFETAKESLGETNEIRDAYLMKDVASLVFIIGRNSAL